MPIAHLPLKTHKGGFLGHVGGVHVGLYGGKIEGPRGVAEFDIVSVKDAFGDKYYASSGNGVVRDFDAADGHIRILANVAGAASSGQRGS